MTVGKNEGPGLFSRDFGNNNFSRTGDPKKKLSAQMCESVSSILLIDVYL